MREIEQRALDAFRTQFGGEPALIASAPGRVNIIGEHTDYNSGFVLPCAIGRRVAVALRPGTGTIVSDDFHDTRNLHDPRDRSWADYPRGVMWALRERGAEPPLWDGAFAGDVPRGSGLSSSAAIESATGLALDEWAALGLTRTDLALTCQRAENGYVGVNSGIMDQYASLLCEAGSALLIDCRSLEAESVPLDLESADLVLLVCDTRVERGLEATAYNERRAASERAAEQLGVESLRDARPSDLARLTGEELKRARHVVTENERVLAAVQALRRGDFTELGRLMLVSHQSLRDDYEVSIGQLDTAVDAAMACGALGARLTGAGFGGCAIALVPRPRAAEVSDAIAHAFAEKAYIEPRFYTFEPAPGAEIAS